MKKLLFVTDVHARSVSPASRLDADFMSAIEDKLGHVAAIASDKRVDMVILGGDMFDRPDVPNSVIIRIMRAMHKIPGQVLSIVGQHDIYGYQKKSVATSAIGVLNESGSLRVFDSISDKGIFIKAIHAYDKTDLNIDESAKINIIVAHKLITNKSIPGAISIAALEETNKANIILSGDMHEPHDIMVNGRLYLNPGSLTRLSISDINRKPQVAIITINDDYSFSHELVIVPHKPSDGIFDAAGYTEEKLQERRTEDFVKTYASAVMSVKAEAYKIGTGLRDFMKANSIPEPVKKKVTEYYEGSEKNVLENNKDAQ